ncbi:polysaccharide deacetylase family protein [bacterium]|nr:polysaccharide deacetylase family protein [bacterium]
MNTLSYIHIPALAFHKIDNKFEWGVTRVSPHKFYKIIRYLSEAGYETITTNDLDRPEELPLKPIMIHFDDAYDSVFKYAFPILKKFNMKATIFVITQFIGKNNYWDVNLGGKLFKHASWHQLEQLVAAGWEIGSHTECHPDLTRISSKRIKKECLQSKIELESRLNTVINSIAPPFGRYNKHVLQTAINSGYQRICVFWNSKITTNYKEIIVIERKACYLFDTIFTIKAKCGNNLWTKLELIKLRIINFFSHGTAIVKPARPMADPSSSKKCRMN